MKISRLTAKTGQLGAKAANFGKNLGQKVNNSLGDLWKFLKKELDEFLEAVKSGNLIEWLKKKIFEFTDDVDEIAKILKKKPKYGRIYRVQGGNQQPNYSKYRFFIRNKKVYIEGESMVHVTFDDTYRVATFWGKRGNKAEVFSADIKQEFIDKIKKDAVPEFRRKEFPDRPQIDDPTKTNSSFGIPKNYFEELLDSIKNPEIIKTNEL